MNQRHYAYQQPRPRRKVWPWVLGIMAVMFAGFVGCTALVGAAVEEVTAPKTLVYTVEGDGDPTVSFWQSGGMGTESGAQLPWTKEVTSDGFNWGSVTVTLDGNGGSVTCRIATPEGQVIAENSASGEFSMASCNGTAPIN